jgi:hypothetical protein
LGQDQVLGQGHLPRLHDSVLLGGRRSSDDVHPTLADARAARGLPPHPAPRTAGQWPLGRQHRAGARAARRAGPLRTARCLRGPSGRRTPHAATSVPLLRWTHVHHRDLRARQRAKVPTSAGRDQDRNLMMLSSLIQHRTEARHFGRLSPGSTPRLRRSASLGGRAGANERIALARQDLRCDRGPRYELTRSHRQRRLNFPNTHADTKSHSPAELSVPHTPRFRALALFGRRLSERGGGLGMPASKSLHITGSRQSRGFRALLRPHGNAGGPTAVNSQHRSGPRLTRTRRTAPTTTITGRRSTGSSTRSGWGRPLKEATQYSPEWDRDR